ncbi:MAG TPA: hypothetical protein VGA93_00770 [Actinomycetota bacterium]
MTGRVSGERIRVAIAGNIYAKRALVRRFLEDDGFAVAAEARDREELFAALRSQEPDALVLDDDLAPWDLGEIRKSAPDAKIVLFTSGAPDASRVPAGADGYLQKGVGLGHLTLLLRELLAQPQAPIVLPAAPPVAVPHGPEHERRVALRLGAIAAALVLVAVGALAVISRPDEPRPGPRATSTGGPVVPEGPKLTVLDRALVDLRDLRGALRDGSYVLAGALARSLMANREAALDEGFSVSGLDAAIRSTLQPLVGILAPEVIPTLRTILGNLFPPVPPLEGTDGGGGIILTGGDDGGSLGGGEAPGGEGQTGGGDGGGDGGGGIDGDGDGGGGGDGGGDGGGGEGSNGKHFGWRNKPPEGGWKGENPKRHGPKHKDK